MRQVFEKENAYRSENGRMIRAIAKLKKEEYELKTAPDVTHITFSTDTESCPICSPWDTLSDRYFELIDYSMLGDKKSIYILVNFLIFFIFRLWKFIIH